MTALVARPSPMHRISRDLLSLGLYELWFRRTSYAVRGSELVVGRGVLAREEIRIPTSRIASVQVHLGSNSGSVAIDTGSGRFTAVAPDLSRRDARRFADAIIASAAGRRTLAARTPRRRASGRTRSELAAVLLGVVVVAAADRGRRLRRGHARSELTDVAEAASGTPGR